MQVVNILIEKSAKSVGVPIISKKCRGAIFKEELFLAGGGAGAGAGAAAEGKRYYKGQVANTSCEIWVLYVYVCVLFKLFKY